MTLYHRTSPRNQIGRFRSWHNHTFRLFFRTDNRRGLMMVPFESLSLACSFVALVRECGWLQLWLLMAKVLIGVDDRNSAIINANVRRRETDGILPCLMIWCDMMWYDVIWYSGSGWPSFWKTKDVKRVVYKREYSYCIVLCAVCVLCVVLCSFVFTIVIFWKTKKVWILYDGTVLNQSNQVKAKQRNDLFCWDIQYHFSLSCPLRCKFAMFVCIYVCMYAVCACVLVCYVGFVLSYHTKVLRGTMMFAVIYHCILNMNIDILTKEWLHCWNVWMHCIESNQSDSTDCAI